MTEGVLPRRNLKGMIALHIKYTQEKVAFARLLRKNMTKHERKLWFCYLKSYFPRFQRQKIIGCFIADFYCHKTKLVIELDGSQHYENKSIEYDEQRSAFFADLGISVLRFSNTDINERFESVCAAIDSRCRSTIT